MASFFVPPAHAILLACLLLATGAGARADTEGQGFAEVRVARGWGIAGERWQTVERVRPTFSTPLGERARVVATVEAGLAQGRDAPDVRTAADYLEVERLYVDAYGGAVDARAGRQAIHWGSARYFNPTDPFPEFLLAEPWRPRRGVNALRLHAAVADRSELTVVGALDDALARPRGAVRAWLNRGGTDLALVGSWPGGTRWLAGVDLRGTLGVGWWVEAAARSAGAATADVAVGLDYSFPVLENLVVMAQYDRDGGGRPGALPAPRDAMLAGVTLQAGPEASCGVAALRSLLDPAGAVVPQAAWAPTGWLEVAAAGQLALPGAGAGAVTVWTRASF